MLLIAVLLGIIGTILFIRGLARILSIWDQTDVKGNPPEGFSYGSEYTREEINRALQADNPLEVVPHRDENGHGTLWQG